MNNNMNGQNRNMQRMNTPCGCSRGFNNSNSMGQQNPYMRNMMPPEPVKDRDCGCDRDDSDRSARPKPDRRRLMQEIYEVGFAMVEIVLFLDTHPSDADALNYYHKLHHRYAEIMQLYSKEFGPLLSSNVMSENYWSWVATPMPWEVEGC